ncbi:hypothetical protein L218DRAFT_870388, partial [Marasmius fiardii PR-910]
MFYTPLSVLWDKIAGVGASHDSDLQFARGCCMPGTRKAVLQLLRDWKDLQCYHFPVCWLSGAAGTGKSAIALSIAKEWEKKGLVDSFFFFRSDLKHNNPDSLILSIAHSLADMRPHLHHSIHQKVHKYPHILEATLENQYTEVVLSNLNYPPHSLLFPSRIPDLVIIDGLDECGDATTQQRV